MISTPTFEAAEADFQRFAMNEGYPAMLLWTIPDELVFWRRRFLVCSGNSEGRRERAKAMFDQAAAKRIGIAIEGRCKTDRFTICRDYVPGDETDAQSRMIPQTGVKMSVALH